MVKNAELRELVQQKLAAFSKIEQDFEQSFLFVQEVHGQKRFATFPVAFSVRYLHARWIVECKSSLLSVPKTIKEDEGALCLEILRDWQQGDTARAVDFLYRRLDMLPVADLTQQIQQVRHLQQREDLAQRLEHGRMVLVSRGMNLMAALDAIFALPEEELLTQVRHSCKQYGHTLEQIEQQLQDAQTPLYQYVPHQELASYNMRVMNKLGENIASQPGEQPGQRSWRVVSPKEPLQPFAEHVVEGYQELVAPNHNNINADRFADRPERSQEEEV